MKKKISKDVQCSLADIMYKGEQVIHAYVVEVCFHEIPLYQLRYFQSSYVSVYILFVFLLSLPSQTTWISHLSFQMAFAAIWSLNFELDSTGEWKIS